MFLNVEIGPLVNDLVAFLPELILCAAIVLMLVLRLLPGTGRGHAGWLALGMTLVALLVSADQFGLFGITSEGEPTALTNLFGLVPPATRADVFTGLLVYDPFTVFLRLFLLGFAALVIWLTMLTNIPDAEDSADFYTLLLGATVGMSLMASANHLLMVFIGVEMASLPSYALAGFLKGKRQSSEASLKYVVYGGGAAGVMLYGISLLAGKFGTGYLPDLAAGYLAVLNGPFDPVLVLGTLFVFVGFAFKLAAVPFHFWCPDVFEGAAAEVAGFLSVASKGAALALLGRFALTLSGASGAQVPQDQWLNVVRLLLPTLAVFAAVTATFGNLAAYLQTNLKRLLAYSTIAHAGYMMMGLAVLRSDGASAVLFYLIVYLFMNLGAFAVVAFLRNLTGSEDLKDFRGLVQRAPRLVITLAVFLLSLLGIPPLAGFAAKFRVFAALFEGGQYYAGLGEPALANTLYALLVIGGLNTVISAVYYVKVLKVMILDERAEDVEGRAPVPLTEPLPSAAYAVLLSVTIFVVGVWWNPLAAASDRGVRPFERVGPPPAAGPQARRAQP